MAPPAAALNENSYMDLPRSNSQPALGNEYSSFSFDFDPIPALPALPAQQTPRRPSLAPRSIMTPPRGRPATHHQRSFTNPFAGYEEELPITPAMPQRNKSIDPMVRRPSHKPRVSFHDTEYGQGHSRAQSFSGMPPHDQRLNPAQHFRSQSVSQGRKSLSRGNSVVAAPDDEDYEAQMIFNTRANSIANLKKQSVSSTYIGDSYRGSISADVLAKFDLVEKAMELEEEGERDVEMQKDQKRPFLLTHACLVSGAAGGVVLLDVWCLAKLVSESRLDGGYARWALCVTIPFFSVFSLFFLIVISGSFFQLFGPLGALQQNSIHYSAKAPKLDEHPGIELPHITIQLPVYKEGLKGVIMPTITSVLKAVNYYERHGGTATIYVNDDGMQLISEELQEARKVYYELHNVAWCARPKQCTTPGDDYFLRKGKFKKASNLNYALNFSLRVETEFIRLMDERCKEEKMTIEDISVDEEEEMLEQARKTVQDSDNGRTWSAGDVRVGEIILLIDSDTRVPEDCLLCGALEMFESPEVAIIQHGSGVMNMTNNPFENGITYFTNLIYTSIAHAVGSGDVAPFVGHNAFLRWRAIQSISFQEDGRTKFWSENHVSEDFDVSLRLQMAHFVVRMAGYHNGEFKEGVSLTVYDELARWEKYAYGCNELLFHPIIYWPTRGIFTPLFKQFLGSNIKITSKFTIIAYIGTYYAIAVGFPLSIANYIIAGLNFQLDHYYQTSWRIFVGLCAVYNILSPISFAMLRYRMGQASYISALGDCIKWMPLFLLFFGVSPSQKQSLQ